MRTIFSALMIPAVCFTLAADVTGRFAGKVVNKAGLPLPGASVLLERIEIKWAKELKTTAKGTFIQVGLDPKEYNITVTAEGYVTRKAKVKIPLGDTLNETYTMLTPDEQRAEAPVSGAATVARDPGEAKENEGSAAFNAGVNFYNEQKYAEALPFIEKAYLSLKESIATTKDATAKAETEGKLPTIERVYGIVLVEANKNDETKKAEVAKAEPFLTPAYEKNPKDQRLVVCLLEVAKAKNDPEMTKKYQAALDALIGPRPELAYNDAVAAFNAEKYKDAKVALQKAIQTDPKFADSYYLMGVVEFSLGNTKGAKEAFKKYQELAPNGKKASEVKEFLRELK